MNYRAQSSVLRSGPCYTGSQGGVSQCFSELQPQLWPLRAERGTCFSYQELSQEASWLFLLWQKPTLGQSRGEGDDEEVKKELEERTFLEKLHCIKLPGFIIMHVVLLS